MIRTLKRMKFFNEIFDFFQYDKLHIQASLYRKFGLKKWYFSSLSSKDFVNLSSLDSPWLDKNESRYVLLRNFVFLKLDNNTKSALLDWSYNGYAILRDFFTDDDIAQILDEIFAIIIKNKINVMDKGRYELDLKSFQRSNELVDSPILRKILGLILGKSVEPSQKAVVLQGSEDSPHADFYHLSTFPLGYQITVLLVLEDFDEMNSPIYCFPGSHKLPYVTNNDFDHGGGSWFLGKNAKKRYSDKIKNIIKEQGKERMVLTGSKGDVFIWHANMIHGGRKTPEFSIPGKALVLHYFATGVLRYHEITQRPYLSP